MHKYLRAIALVLAATAVLQASEGRGDEPPGQGRFARVAADLRANGKAWTEQGLTWLMQREAVGHLTFLATDPRGGMGGGGWYKPSQSRYDWEWLRRRLDKDGDGAVSFKEFDGPREWFEALDKNRDGSLTKEDFEWFGDSPLAQASTKAKTLFAQVDSDSNGQVTAAEWQKWFESFAGKKGFIGQDDLMTLFMDKRPGGARGAGRPPGGMNRLPVLCAYISGDVGSLSEGPAVGEPAPYFTLATSDGAGKIDLSRHRGRKPLVLIFGSFT